MTKTWLASGDLMSFYRIDKLGIQYHSCGLDKLDQIDVQMKTLESFRDSNSKLIVFNLKSPPDRRTPSHQNPATG